MAILLKGTPVAEAIGQRTAFAVSKLAARGVTPTLAILRTGEGADAVAYENSAVRACEKYGVAARRVTLSGDVSKAEFIGRLSALNADGLVHGILVLQPLSPGLDFRTIRNLIPLRKDVDGITNASLGGVFAGSETAFAPCTAQAVAEILGFYKIPVSGKKIAVVGRSLVVGKPAAVLLTGKNATVTLCHSHTAGLAEITRAADIAVIATGRTESFGAEYFSPGQTVIDVGIGWSDKKQKLCGDVIFDEVEPIVNAITPVPGGLGSVTSSILANHTALAADAAQKRLLYLKQG